MKRTDYLTVIISIRDGVRGTVIDGAFSTQNRAEDWADSTYLPNEWDEKREIKPSNVESIDKTAFRYFETKKGDQCWICVVPMEVD